MKNKTVLGVLLILMTVCLSFGCNSIQAGEPPGDVEYVMGYDHTNSFDVIVSDLAPTSINTLDFSETKVFTKSIQSETAHGAYSAFIERGAPEASTIISNGITLNRTQEATSQKRMLFNDNISMSTKQYDIENAWYISRYSEDLTNPLL